MSGTAPSVVVVDASAMVALLIDDAEAGEWVTAVWGGSSLAAPALLAFEVGKVLRRCEITALIDPSSAALAHHDLLDLPLVLWPYAALAERAWELRHNVTIYDASYVALAELLAAPLITLDARLARAAGPRCEIIAFTT